MRPELLTEFATEKYVEKDEESADDYEAEGSTELEVCAQYCRACTVSVQRLFHVRSLGHVCKQAMTEGNEVFPLDLIEELAQDDDSEVRQIVAEQLGTLAEAIKQTRGRQEEDVATGLLCVAFLLVEDDIEQVVTAAEAAVATVASLLDPASEGQEVLLTQMANLITGEEEEIRLSGAKIVGTLAAVLGPGGAKENLVPLLEALTQDESFRVREVAVHAVVLVAQVMEDAEAEQSVLPFFFSLLRDPVWAVRKACAEELVMLAKCVSREVFVELASAIFEPMANDVSYQVGWGRMATTSNTILSQVSGCIYTVSHFHRGATFSLLPPRSRSNQPQK